MEKPTNEERNEQDTQVDVSNLSDEELQRGIDANIEAMTQAFVGRLTMLQQLTKRTIAVKVKADMVDGRSIYIRVR